MNERESGFAHAKPLSPFEGSPAVGKHVDDALPVGRSGRATGQRLQRLGTDQLFQPPDDRIEHRFGWPRGDLGLPGDCPGRIELASEHAGRTTSHVVARSNIIHSGNSSGISLGGYAAGVGGTEHCSVIGNTLVRNDVRGTGSGELQIQYHASDNLVVDNVLYAGPAGVLVYAYTGDTALPAVFDHNLYWSDAGAAGASWTWRGTDYDSLAAWRTGSSQDAHSPFADPLFLDLLAPDLRVGAGSPAIDAGIDPGDGLAGLLDYAGGPRVAGNAIDIGAHER